MQKYTDAELGEVYAVGIVTLDYNTDSYVDCLGGCKLILNASFITA